MNHEKVFNWYQPLDLRELCVPISKCVTVTLGPVDKTIVGELKKRAFDQAPIVDNKCIYGLISTQRLRQLLDDNQPLTEDDPKIIGEDKVIRGTQGVNLEYLFFRLSESRATLIQDEFANGDHGSSIAVHGLVTISDLNCHALRAVLYRMISALEVSLVHVIDNHYTDPWKWIMHLKEEAQARIIGYWQLSKRKDVDIGPLAATNFTHLLKVIERTQHLLRVVIIDALCNMR